MLLYYYVLTLFDQINESESESNKNSEYKRHRRLKGLKYLQITYNRR